MKCTACKHSIFEDHSPGKVRCKICGTVLYKITSKAIIPSPNKMDLKTTINAEFIYAVQPSPAEQASLDALNGHAEEICEILQPIFYQTFVQMLNLKRGRYAKGDQD